MRVRVCVLACALSLLASVIAAGTTSAAPNHDQGLTIAAAPNPVTAGQGVLVYGQLQGSHNGQQIVRLYHHVNGSRRGYTFVTQTVTDPSGFYEFPRPDGLIYTNRSWYVAGPDGRISHTLREAVSPLVSLAASTTTPSTKRIVVFKGHVTPNHRFEQVLLQQQAESSDHWMTLRWTTLSPGSNYYVAYRWWRPGTRDVRVVFRGDNRNSRGVSNTITINVQQAQVRGFTIGSSAPVVPYGGSATISGTLDKPGTTTPEANTLIQLWGRDGDHRSTVLADGVTDPHGNYSFTQSNLTTNTVYYVATMPGTSSGHRRSALLYEGVRDVVTMQAGSDTASSGKTVSFTGTVLPDKTGRTIALQMLGSDNNWHTVQVTTVQHGSTFQFRDTVGAPGTTLFRARITSDRRNVGSSSPPVTVTTTGSAASTLPPAS